MKPEVEIVKCSWIDDIIIMSKLCGTISQLFIVNWEFIDKEILQSLEDLHKLWIKKLEGKNLREFKEGNITVEHLQSMKCTEAHDCRFRAKDRQCPYAHLCMFIAASASGILMLVSDLIVQGNSNIISQAEEIIHDSWTKIRNLHENFEKELEKAGFDTTKNIRSFIVNKD